MQVVILVVTVFLFGANPPKSLAVVTPDAETCQAVAADAVDKIGQDKTVRFVAVKCVTMKSEDQA